MKTEHPGAFVRREILPNGMKVTEAAERLGISRPALSNFLNGNADLSHDMAVRLERAFSADPQKLLDLQNKYNAEKAGSKDFLHNIELYVPPFLEIKANKIEEWGGSGIEPRRRLAVFLRTLANSTGRQITKINFPGNDDSETPGPDGEIEAEDGSSWVPKGYSIWEFSVSKDITSKANADFKKSVKAFDDAVCRDTTFIFVTPLRWKKKTHWIEEKKKTGLWKNVHAYDASDLEQWLELSFSAQTWFANETGQTAKGTISLDHAWRKWAADCDPKLHSSLFSNAEKLHSDTIIKSLQAEPYQPVAISADSRDEALAFLSCVFSANDEKFCSYRDKTIVFEEKGTLTKLVNRSSDFIAVITSQEVEEEFAPYSKSIRSFLIYPQNTVQEPDIRLETLSYKAFQAALKVMGIEGDRVDQLSRESGRSPTVLRRRLSKLPAIKKPKWANNKDDAKSLIPALFAGAWRADHKADRTMISSLAGGLDYDDYERKFIDLSEIEDSPVWLAGGFRGVVSKIDLFYAIKNTIIEADLKRFFKEAERGLSEPDPTLDLPEKDQLMAAINGKTRESTEILEGLADTLAFLSVHGKSFFSRRINFNVARHADDLVRSLLNMSAINTLENHVDNLPLYAEAAPSTFLSIIKNDLKSANSQALALMRPTDNWIFSNAPRTGLLWALESLAWDPTQLMPTVLILGRLGELAIDDNLVNKPSNSLAAIFRCWMPQTAANIKQRIDALEKLVKEYPSVAWPICLEQFTYPHPPIGYYSNKPCWRHNKQGYDNPITKDEDEEFKLKAFDIAVKWQKHDCNTLGDLISNLRSVSKVLRGQVWDIIDKWKETASEQDKSRLREKIRVAELDHRAINLRRLRDIKSIDKRAIETFETLESADPVYRYEWLFRETWLHISIVEMEDEGFDNKKLDKWIATQRQMALREIYENGGINRIIELAEMGQTAHTIGMMFSIIVDDDQALSEKLLYILRKDTKPHGVQQRILSGALHSLDNQNREILQRLVDLLSADERLIVLLLAPFDHKTWKIVESFDNSFQTDYWSKIHHSRYPSKDDLSYAVGQLIDAKRPKTALNMTHFSFNSLSPRMLYKMLDAIATERNDTDNISRLDSVLVLKALKHLTESKVASIDEMAAFEFKFIEIFNHTSNRPLNLEKYIERHPELFVQAVAFVYKRQDDKKDPKYLRPKNLQQAAAKYDRFLNVLSLIPGHNEHGELKTENLLNWVKAVRSGCSELARAEVGDECIGGLLANDPTLADDEGVWPSLPVRDALEQIANDNIKRGFTTRLYNSRGAHIRSEGGNQERDLADKYAHWAEKMEFTYPNVSDMMREMEEMYLREASWQDNETQKKRRLLH